MCDRKSGHDSEVCASYLARLASDAQIIQAGLQYILFEND